MIVRHDRRTGIALNRAAGKGDDALRPRPRSDTLSGTRRGVEVGAPMRVRMHVHLRHKHGGLHRDCEQDDRSQAQ